MRAIAILSLALIACQAPQPKPKRSPGDRSSTLFSYARPYIAKAELPARFSAPLPFTVEALAAIDRYAPEENIAAALARGDAGMQDRVAEALRRIAARGVVPAALAGFYNRLFGGRPSLAACEFLNRQVRRAAPRPARLVYWSALSRCRDSRYSATFSRADAPDDAVVRWYALADDDDLPFSPRLAAAARQVARRGQLEAREVGDALAHVDRRRAIRVVRELQQQLRDPERRALVAVGMARHSDKAARTLVRRACNHPRVRFDDACSSLGRSAIHVDVDVRTTDTDDRWLVLAHGEAAVVEALHRCVVDGEWDDERAHCLRRLARLDWARAATVAASIEESLVPSSALVADVATLVRFPSPGAMAAALHEVGLIPEAEVNGDGVSPVALLTAHDRAVRIFLEGAASPEEHGQLLIDLANLVGADLDGFAFEASPLAAEGRSRLRAWGDGRVFEVTAGKRTGWFDVSAAVGLLNCLLRVRGSGHRLLVASHGQSLAVVGAPAAAIEAAVEAELVTPR